MGELVDIKVGDSVVDYDQHGWLIDVRVVTSVKPKTFTYREKWHTGGQLDGQDRRRDRSFVVYAGPAEVAARLAEQIKSSRAQRDNAKRQADQQHTARIARFIEEAKAATP